MKPLPRPLSPSAQAVLDASLEAFFEQDDLDSRLVPHVVADVVAAALRAAAKHAPLAAADPYDVLNDIADELSPQQ